MKKPSGDNYLVLGAEGQIGSELARRTEGTLVACRAREAVDICDHAQVRKVIRSCKPAAVVNAAGHNNRLVNDCDRAAMWRTNVEAVANLAKVCALYGVPLVHLSADEVFGGDAKRAVPFTETDVVCPNYYYGMTKVMAEHSVLNVGLRMLPEVVHTDFQYFVIRTSMPYEKISTSRNTFVNRIAALTRKRMDPVAVPVDMIRSPTYVPHLVTHLLWLLSNIRDVPSGIYHIAGGGAASLYEVGAAVCRALRSATEVRPIYRAQLHPKDDLARQPLYTALDCSDWRNICPLPLATWEEGLEECCGGQRLFSGLVPG